METFAGKHVIVAGAGRSGLLAACLLAGEGALVTLRDDRPRVDVEASLREPIPDGIAFLQGMPGKEEVRGSALLVVSPGVSRERLPLSELAAAGVPVWGELELGFRRFHGKVAAITGTNGKSTVTTLVGGMASRAFPRVFVGGNLGTPFVAAAGAPCDWGVVEVSSFQLESIGSFRPRVAALLNLTEDHRDRYAAKEAYFEAKMAVFRNQGPSDTAVVNADDPEVTARLGSIAARLLPFSVSRTLTEGAFLSGGEMVLRKPSGEERYPRRILKIPGLQNVENALAAIAVARSMGVPPSAVLAELERFPGLPHRVEFVRSVAGVSYYNDSKGTNVGAVLAALDGFPEPVVLIAGGKDKGVDFRPLRAPLGRKARAVVLLGEARERMAKELAGAAPIIVVGTLAEAVRAAAEAARKGDAVVFSPACSSFDMFRNFEERGEVFRKTVEELPG
ncbi:MAG: UDP-N-acetylmuramoylalanine--D-glutamate ligase [Deltaproteobacteria bacterium CG2_30_66_27]|nr:MAG: UDP-N-acetylmuramoylalanine--D-glutamate ligase [Deltaproteobacteria bacterium CG2_30_66_27]PJB31380.1 MAG: UDP-N-acetylmuramoyl-L-alanine--D-glutamate ligase [Deltaproteobacteria bacterium CG_4_9_14_3_um_filter_65_9]